MAGSNLRQGNEDIAATVLVRRADRIAFGIGLGLALARVIGSLVILVLVLVLIC